MDGGGEGTSGKRRASPFPSPPAAPWWTVGGRENTERETMEEPSGNRKRSRKDSNSSHLQEQASQQSESLQTSMARDDIFFQGMGEDKHGHVHTHDLNPSPSDLWGETLISERDTTRLAKTEPAIVKLAEQLSLLTAKVDFLITTVCGNRQPPNHFNALEAMPHPQVETAPVPIGNSPSRLQELEILPTKGEEKQVDGDHGKLSFPTKEDGNHVEIDTTELFTTSKIFKDRSEMMDWAKKVGRENEIIIVTAKSDFSDPRKLPRLFLGCERGGKRRTFSKGKRKCTSKRIGCPFKLRCVKLNVDEDKWRIEVVDGVHNHRLGVPGGHTFAGRLMEEEYEIVQSMSKSGVHPKDILTHLKGRDTGNASSLRHIYNALRKKRVEEARHQTDMQKLFKIIDDSGYMERHRVDPSSDKIQDIFWVHPTCVGLVKAFPFVFMMECTYRSNRYILPLLEIVGVTSTDKTFPAAFVYMEAEKEEDYTWALECFKDLFDSSALPSVIVTNGEQGLSNAVTTVFPTAVLLFGRVPVERNVLSPCKKFFVEKKEWEEFSRVWTDLVLAGTEDEYESKLYDLERAYEEYPSVLTCVRDTLKYKQQFVSAWADRYLHFGNISTYRIEISHAKLKRYLCTSMEYFLNSWNTIRILLDQQINAIEASFKQSLTKTPECFRDDFFKELIGVVSIAALEKIQVEIDHSEGVGEDPYACNHFTHRTLGLPCAHMILIYKREGRVLPLSDVHPFWKKLSITPFVDEHTDEFYIFPEIF